jgi:hypothetical protein
MHTDLDWVATKSLESRSTIARSSTNLYEPVLAFPPDTPSFSLGAPKGKTAHQSAQALAKWNDSNTSY